LLGLKNMPDRIEEFPVQLPVLALQVQHGHWLRKGGGTLRRILAVFHLIMVPVCGSTVSHDGRCKWVRRWRSG
jgi:hypothetical protein